MQSRGDSVSSFDTGEASSALQQIRNEILNARAFSEMMPICGKIKNLRTTHEPIRFWELCNDFFFRFVNLFDLSTINLADQRELVFLLVSLSLEDSKGIYPEESSGTRHIEFIQHELRRKLKAMMRQIGIADRWGLLQDLEVDLIKRLLNKPTDSVFVTVSTLGMRSDSIDDALWKVARSNSEVSEIAICTIIDLGVPTSNEVKAKNLRNELIALGRIKLNQNQLNAVTHIIWYLCGPDGMDLVLDAIEKVESMEVRSYDLSMIFAGAAKAIDRCPALSPFHQQVWEVFRRNRPIINMNASFAFGCQSPEPIRDYLEWLVEYSTQDDQNIHYSITKSRISELFKPQHLDGFDLVDKDRISFVLQQIATKDSGVTGGYATTSLDAKQSSIQWLQCLGRDDFDNLNTAVILEETNPYVAHRMADLLSASIQNSFSRELCQQLELASRLDDNDNENSFRQAAVMRLAHASESREAFLSVTRFGYLHQGKVQLSVIDALTDLAIARISQGDSDVFELIFGMISERSAKHHREAGVTALCRLISNGFISSNEANCLWQIAEDQSLDAFSRGSAYVALGSANVKANNEQLQWLREKAFLNDFEHQPEAFEGLLLRKCLYISDYPEAAAFLGCTYEDDQFRIKEPRQVSPWQAHMLAHLYLKDQSHTATAIECILKHASGTAVHQITWAIEQLGECQPAGVLEQLCQRVLASNTRGRADTELLQTLGIVSPKLVAGIVDSGVWRDWLEPGRHALVENLKINTQDESDTIEKAVGCYTAFISDPSFQVRRAAYRGFARLAPEAFALYLNVLSTNEDPELISRAAEGIRWLPSNNFDNDFIDRSGLASHPLPEIRDIAKNAITERRNREWCDLYANELEVAVKENRLDAREFRLGLALEMIGDDETIKRLRKLSSDRFVKPRIRFWLLGILKAVEKQWKKTLGQSAQPWSFIRGSVEKVKGRLYLEDGHREIQAIVHLWKHERKNLSDKYSWGGVLELLEADYFRLDTLRTAELRIQDRKSSKIQVWESTWSSNNKPWLTFSSNSPWPED